MWYRHWGLEKAYSYLKSKRSIIAPNLNFMRQLHEFEGQLEASGRGAANATMARINNNNNSKANRPSGSSSSSTTSGHSSSSSYLSTFSNLDCMSPRQLAKLQAAASCSDAAASNAALKSLSLTGGTLDCSPTSVGVGVEDIARLDQEVFLLPGQAAAKVTLMDSMATVTTSSSNSSNTMTTIADYVASIPESSSSLHPPPSLSANLLLSSSMQAHSPGHQHPASAKPVFNLPLTPCTRQANVFSFDSPIVSPLTQPHTNSPTLPVCHSPLVSPS